jgi:hypothetical protein
MGAVIMALVYKYQSQSYLTMNPKTMIAINKASVLDNGFSRLYAAKRGGFVCIITRQ